MNKSSLANNYKRRNLSFKKGIGSFLYSSKGEKYLDFVQGIAVNTLGHSNPNLIKALNKQSKKLWHVSNAFIIPEGEKLAKVLQRQLQGISDCIDATEIILVRRGQDKSERLQVQLNNILKAQPPLSEDRLLQELALIAIKSDITEELDRLRSHVVASKELLKDSDPKGRRLDFLCQEFNREANTICSKANDAELTKHGLEMKALIEQFREQVQNVE